MNKNILSILDTYPETEEIIDLATEIKSDFYSGKKIDYLKDKTLAMIFERASTRTRVSFEVGIKKLGGQAIFLNKEDIKIGERESVEDIALVLSRYVDLIMYRALKKEDLHNMAKFATVPVINGLDEEEHPCQILADLMTIKEKKGGFKGLNFVFIGDGNDNLNHSYLLGCTTVGMNVTIITKKSYWPDDYYISEARKISERKNLKLIITEDINAINDADVVATDTWVSLWYENNRKKIIDDLKLYTITEDIINKAKKDAIFLHCMPIYYGEEVVKEVAHGPKSVIFEEAENRMWTQMALMINLLK